MIVFKSRVACVTPPGRMEWTGLGLYNISNVRNFRKMFREEAIPKFGREDLAWQE